MENKKQNHPQSDHAKSNSVTRSTSRSFESNALISLLILFSFVMAAGWFYAMKVSKTITADQVAINKDVSSLVEIEKIKNLSDSHIATARAYFLLGSKTLLDKYRTDQTAFVESLLAFEKQYGLPGVADALRRIEGYEKQLKEIFDQGVDFRDKQTESKIVGQFYQSKAGALRNQIQDALEEVRKLHQAEFEKAQEQARRVSAEVETKIPKGMTWFTGSLTLLFIALALLVLRMLQERGRKVAERDRLYNEAQKSILARDGLVAAITSDLKDPLMAINQAADSLKFSTDAGGVSERAEYIQSQVEELQRLVSEMVDQATADQGHLSLRLDQLPMDDVIEDARITLQPIAKQNDVRLQFDTVNPPVLAFLDRERVRRVMLNLVGNAIKFSPKNAKVTVKVRSDQQFVFVSIIDNGPGIPENQQQNLFQNYWQARKTADQGAGVGLAVVKTIVEAHGGTVRVDSNATGSTFTFSLPRRRPVGAQINRPTTTTKPITRPSIQADSLN